MNFTTTSLYFLLICLITSVQIIKRIASTKPIRNPVVYNTPRSCIIIPKKCYCVYIRDKVLTVANAHWGLLPVTLSGHERVTYCRMACAADDFPRCSGLCRERYGSVGDTLHSIICLYCTVRTALM